MTPLSSRLIGFIIRALFVNLGRERAKLTEEGITQPVWGDELIDPLQFLLFSYAIARAGAEDDDALAGTTASVVEPVVLPASGGGLGDYRS